MNKNQKITIAVMAFVGLLLAALMLVPRRAAGPVGEGKAAATAAAGPAADAAASEHKPPEHGEHTAEQPETVTLDDAQLKAAGVVLAVAAPSRIGASITLPGEIRFNEDRTAHVVPKLAGVVTSVRAELGQNVKQGQVLAVIASSALSEQRSELLSAQRRLALARTTFERERRLWQDKISAEQDYLQAQQALGEAEIAVRNARQKLDAIGAGTATSTGAGKGAGSGSGAGLNRLELRAPFDGVVMEKHLALGEAVKEDAAVFTISDLSHVWAEIAVPPRDLALVRVGETVLVKASALDAQASGKITYVGSLLGEQTRTAKARVSLANPDRAWRPGLFVSVDVPSGQATDAAVTVAADAVQTVDDKPVVFVKVAGGLRAQPVTPGRSDGRHTEILKGLQAGAHYAAAGSFVLKAELGKDSAEHAH